jgi:hypothetical protein
MANYTKTVNFAAKDTLASGNPAKIVKGSEIDTEFNNIATKMATKSDIADPTFTGTVTLANLTATGNASVGGTLTVTGTATIGTIDGGTY